MTARTPDPERLSQITEGARALPPAQREAYVRGAAGADETLLEAALHSLSAGAAVTGEREGTETPPPVTDGAVQSSATDELMERLSESPKLDVERYGFEGEVDRGGMGAILKIHDRHLNRRLAMKVLIERAPPGDEFEERLLHQLLGRFLEEAQVTSQLDHPGVVPVHELGLDQNGKAFFTMRLVKGRTASAVFKDVRKGGTEWTLTRAIEVMLKVCDTMAFAHNKGILHRDLKPENVMVGRFGEVYVMDWGLAKILGQTDQHDLRIQPSPQAAESAIHSVRGNEADAGTAGSVLSMDGQKLGTPSYMSPEQARSEELDPRADVYSIGAMLYELLAGRAPYTIPGVRKNAYAILEDLVDGPPKRIEEIAKGVPAELIAIAGKAMARDREERYADVRALASDLRAYLDHRVVQAHQTGAVVELKLWVRRNKPLAASLLAAAGILVVGAIVSTTLARRNANLAEEKSSLAQAETAAKNIALEEKARAKLAAEENARLANEMRDLARAEAAARVEIADRSYVANVQIAGAWVDLGRLDYALERLRSCPPSSRRWEWQWLFANADNSLVELKGHAGSVGRAIFSPDGTRIVTSALHSSPRVWSAETGEMVLELEGKRGALGFSPDGERILTLDASNVQVLDAAAGGLLLELKGQTEGIHGAAFSPDGSKIVTASDDSKTRVWDATSGAQILELEGSTPGSDHSAEFSPDGTRIVTWSMSATPCLWDPETGKLITKLVEQESSVWSLSFGGDGTKLVAGGADGIARVWDVSTGRQVAELKADLGPVTSGILSPDGTKLVTCVPSLPPSLWDVATGKRLARMEGHTAWVRLADFSPDGTRIVTASEDDTARIWDASTGALDVELKGHSADLLTVMFNHDGTRIVTGSEDETARLWDVMALPAAPELKGHSDMCWTVNFNPSGTRLLTTSDDHTARVWDPYVQESLLELTGHTEAVISGEFSPDGSRIVTASRDNTARVWNAATGETTAELNGHTGIVWSAAFSHDGTRILTCARDRTARVWGAATGEAISVLEGHPEEISTAAFSPDSTRVVTACRDMSARVFDASTGDLITELKGHRVPLMLASFSPDGERILTGDGTGTVRLWDTSTGEAVAELKGQTGALTCAAFSPDGKTVVTTSRSSVARIWDSATGGLLAELKGHTRWILHASFSADGTRILTAAMDNTARVWDAATGTRLVELKGHTSPVRQARFSPDGTLIVTTSQDDTVRIWDAARHAVRFAEAQQSPEDRRSRRLRRQFARELRGEASPTWLSSPLLPGNRPNFLR